MVRLAFLKHATFIFLFLFNISFAADYYVDTVNGNDSNPGTSQSSAWKTISKVNTRTFSPGDKILFKRGQQFNGQLVFSSSGTSSDPITIAAYGTGERPVFIATGQSITLKLDWRKHLIVKDLHVKDGHFGIDFLGNASNYVDNIVFDNILIDGCDLGMYADHAKNIVIKNSIIQNSRQSHGIYFGGGSDNVIIENNIIKNNKKSGIHFNCDANATPSSNMVVRFNRIYGNESYGVMNTATKNSEFYYNLIYNNLGYGLQFEYDTHASGFAPNNNKVYNNVFYNNSGPSIYFGSGTNGNIVKNNILHQGTQNMYLVSVKPSDKSNNFSNNLYYGAVNSGLWLKSGSIYSSYSQWASVSGDQNSIAQQDPMFNNLSASDFTLKSNSPAVGKGVNVGLTVDFAGNPVSGNPNIGAYQSGTVNSDNTPPSLVSASVNSATSVSLTFSEKINSSDAVNVSNYSINNGVGVSAASLASNGLNVTLTTTANSPGQTNTITVKNIRDLAGNSIGSNNSAQYKLPEEQNTYAKMNVVGVTASSQFYDDQGPENTIDGDLNTTWTGSPMPTYLVYDLGTVKTVAQTKFSFYAFSSGRTYNYTVAISADGQSWTNVVSNKISSVQQWTNDSFGERSARYVRLTLNSSNATSLWATVYEAEIMGIEQSSENTNSKLQIVNVSASSQFYETDGPEKTIDGDLNSTWTGTPMPANLIYDLGSVKTVEETRFSFYAFSSGRIYNYTVSLSADGQNWINVVTNKSSSSQRWTIDNIGQRTARYIKLTLNSANTTSLWATVYEAEIYGVDAASEGNEIKLNVTNASASSQFYENDGPNKTVDGDVNSTWTGTPMPANLVYDLGSVKQISQTRISFYAYSSGRVYNYNIDVSSDAKNWISVVSNKTSSSQQWTVDKFNKQSARYIRVTLNSSNTTSLWATVYEVEIWGYNQLGKENLPETETSESTPKEFSLNQNYPNPFNPTTQISFTIAKEDFVSLKIYDVLGKEVATLVNERMQPGNYSVNFDASNLASSVYIYRLTSNNLVLTRKMILQK